MAVAEKTSKSEKKQTSPVQQLPLSSMIGGVYILVGAGIIFSGIPVLWYTYVAPILNNIYLSNSLLVFLCGLTAAGLVYLGTKLEGPQPAKGLRAGSLFAFAALFVTLILALAGVQVIVGAELPALVAWALVGVFSVALIAGTFWILSLPAFSEWLLKTESNNWFHARAYKYNQGMKVRRATLVASLIVVGFGVFWAVQNNFFGSGIWSYDLPGTDFAVYILFYTQYTAPLIVLGLLLWVCWRIINLPVFADFLIATEAEMNKVSWTTRKRLVQDTIVVLVTVFLLTAFLFVVDLLWIRLLSLPVPGVLRVDVREEMKKQMAPTEW